MSHDQFGPAELVPPDQSTVLYAIGELKVYLDLYPLSGEGRTSVAAIIETLRGIDGATSKKAVGEALGGVVGQWVVEDGQSIAPPAAPPLRIVSTPTASHIPSPDDYETVCAEIVRRETWLGEMREVQADVEGFLEEVEDDIQKNEGMLRCCTREEAPPLRLTSSTLHARKRHIMDARSALTTLHETAKSELDQLREYLRALEVVRAGCPRGLLGVSLPSIPSFSEEGIGVIPVKPQSEVKEFHGDRHAVLGRIAQENGMSEAEAFILSLYELFGPRNERLVRQNGMRALNRGCRRVVESALALIPGLRWRNHHECYTEVAASGRRLNDSGFIKYVGSPSDAAQTFLRTEKPLPWDSTTLFSPAEIAAFVAEMALSQEELRERAGE